MKIGFIGLGAMGRGMAANLQKAGHALTVTDLVRDAAASHLANGAAWADSPRELAQACDVVFTSLPTPADVEAVCHGPHGLAAGLRKGSVWFDLTTNAVDVVRKLHGMLAGQGVDFLDAPVSGGPSGAASGRLALWVGGDEAAFERCKPLLDAMGDQAMYVGAIGAGTIAKLVHNVSSTAISTVMAEVFSLGVKAGLEPLALWTAVSQGAIGRQRTFEKVATRMFPGQFDPPSFALRLVHKDMQLGLQLARDFNVPMRLCALAGLEVTEALNRGWGHRDAMASTLLQQERAGIEPFAVPMDEVKAAMAKVSKA
jgi:3-hydroxyisobutyrate dehydrogenase-like beta-hydroxyacid dehydrogenase